MPRPLVRRRSSTDLALSHDEVAPDWWACPMFDTDPAGYATNPGDAAAPTLQAARAVGVLRRREACRAYGEGRVCAELEGRRWQAPTSLIVVQHNGPLTDDQRMWVTLLTAPPGAMLHGLSAANHDGLRGFTPDALTVVIAGASRNPRGRQLAVPEEWGVEVRWSTKLGLDDVNTTALPPRTRLPRSLIDAASERVAERRARVIVLAAVQQRLVRTGSLWDALSRRGRCRNRAIIAESIRDAEGGIESLPEREFDVIRARRRLPLPTRQQVLRRRDGRYFLDADWPEFGVRSEIHGIPHSEIRNWDNDLLRQNDLNIGGGGLLVFSSYAIRHLPDPVGDQLEAMFVRRGFRTR
ncbi:MAG: hypothetical protein ABJA81_07630 [Nocardioidaceae bacterium]